VVLQFGCHSEQETSRGCNSSPVFLTSPTSSHLSCNHLAHNSIRGGRVVSRAPAPTNHHENTSRHLLPLAPPTLANPTSKQHMLIFCMSDQGRLTTTGTPASPCDLPGSVELFSGQPFPASTRMTSRAGSVWCLRAHTTNVGPGSSRYNPDLFLFILCLVLRTLTIQTRDRTFNQQVYILILCFWIILDCCKLLVFLMCY
jgi:hypothetical protein